MANLPRTSKSGSDWSIFYLEAYNIVLKQETVNEFFGVQDLPNPVVDPELLHNLDTHHMRNNGNVQLIHKLDLAEASSVAHESFVTSFIDKLFEVLGYACGSRTVYVQKAITFPVCGQNREGEVDICLVDRDQGDEVLLLVHTNERQQKRHRSAVCAQLITEALAVFKEENFISLSPVDHKVMPGIVMDGTFPTFLKIPVTEELVANVRHGTYPTTPTIVTFCSPRMVPPIRRERGMKPLDNRLEILKCFEAFKTIIGI